jgi:hypothetical protein
MSYIQLLMCKNIHALNLVLTLLLFQSTYIVLELLIYCHCGQSEKSCDLYLQEVLVIIDFSHSFEMIEH